MKTQFNRKIGWGFVIAITIFSCKKETINQAEPQAGGACHVSAVDGRLKFETVGDYGNVANNPTPAQTTAFLKQIHSFSNFISVASMHSSSTARIADGSLLDSLLGEDDFLKSILNPDGVVQIGNYIFKLDPANGVGYVLDVKYSDQLADLTSGNVSNPNIMVFDIEDDALELLQDGVLGTIKNLDSTMALRRCKEKRAPRRTNTVIAPYGSGYRLNCILEYQPMLIHFKIFATVKNQSKFLGLWLPQDGLLWIDYNASWKQRCHDSGSASQSCPTQECWHAARGWTETIYSSFRALSSYNASAVCYNRAANVSAALHIQYP